jgi:hypothetical protein
MFKLFGVNFRQKLFFFWSWRESELFYLVLKNLQYRKPANEYLHSTQFFKSFLLKKIKSWMRVETSKKIFFLSYFYVFPHFYEIYECLLIIFRFLIKFGTN